MLLVACDLHDGFSVCQSLIFLNYLLRLDSGNGTKKAKQLCRA